MATAQSHKGHTYSTYIQRYTILRWQCPGATSFRPKQSYILSPCFSGYHRVQFSSLHFPPGCLGLTRLRNKTSTRNFMLTSPIFTSQMKENARNIKIRAPYSFLFLVLLIAQSNTSKRVERGRGGAFHLGSISVWWQTGAHTHAHRQKYQRMNTHTPEMLPGERFRKQN